MRALLLIPFLLVSCMATGEKMTRADGSSYTYFAMQMAGAGESHGSSGAGHTFDGQKSFQDLLTGAGTIATTGAYKAQQLAKEATARNAANQVTVQQKNAADAANAAAAIAAKKEVTTTAIGAGAEVTPITVTPP